MSTPDVAKIKAVVDSVLGAKRSAEDLAHTVSTKVKEVKSQSADQLSPGETLQSKLINR
jgi:hypothetical protein